MGEPIRMHLAENDRIYVLEGEHYVIRDICTCIPEVDRELLIRWLINAMRYEGISAADFSYVFEFVEFKARDEKGGIANDRPAKFQRNRQLD